MDPVNDKSTCAPYDRPSTPELSPRKRTEIFNPIHWLLPVSSIALIDTYEKLRFEQDIQEHYRRPWNSLRRLWNKVFNGEIWLACRVSFKERASSLEIENFTKAALTARSVRSKNDQFAFKLSSASQPRTRSEPASLCSSNTWSTRYAADNGLVRSVPKRWRLPFPIADEDDEDRAALCIFLRFLALRYDTTIVTYCSIKDWKSSETICT